MAENHKRSPRKSKTGPIKWIVLSAAVALAALAGSRTGTADSSRERDRAGVAAVQGNSVAGEDPFLAFEQSRRRRRLTIEAPRPVLEARAAWLARQTGTAAQPESGALGAPATAIETNLDLALNAYQGETAIAVNPNAPLHLVGGANTFLADPNCPPPTGANGGTQTLYGSTDGGNTWTLNCAPWPSSLNQGQGDTSFGSDPAVAWDASGNAYAAYLLVNCNASTCNASASDAIEVAKSTDSGTTWTSLGQVVNNLGNPTAFDDKEMIAVDTTSGSQSHPGRIYVIYDEAGTVGQPEQVAHSDDGVTWAIKAVDTPAASDSGGDVAIGPGGQVYAIWNQLGTNTEITVFAMSLDGGNTWTAPIPVATHTLMSFGSNNLIPAQDVRGINSFAAIAVDRSGSANNGNLYVAYTDLPSSSAGADTNIYFVRSTNQGATWSSPIKVNDDSGAASQFFGWLDVDQGSGDVALAWYDTRNDSTGKNTRTQIFSSQSVDGGATFQSNVQVTSANLNFANNVDYSDENCSPDKNGRCTHNVNVNLNQYGDYAQVAFLNGIAHPLWCDSRNFFPADSSNPLFEDAASAQVNFTASATPTATPTPVAAKFMVRPPKTANFPPQVTLGGQGGQNSKPIRAILTNGDKPKTGLPIQIENVQVTGSDFSFFPGSPSNPCVGTLYPRGTPARPYSCAVNLAFSPTQPGPRSGSLVITTNTTVGQYTIELRGTGRQGKLIYNPKALSLSTSVGNTSHHKAVIVRNPNPVPLQIGTPSVPDSNEFQLSGNCLGSLSAAGQSGDRCEEDVTFRPSARGTVHAHLVFNDDAVGAPHRVNLTGVGK